jgi:hypothetical protein
MEWFDAETRKAVLYDKYQNKIIGKMGVLRWDGDPPDFENDVFEYAFFKICVLKMLFFKFEKAGFGNPKLKFWNSKIANFK